MTLQALLIFLVIGAIAGWLAGLIIKGSGFGLIGDIIIGVIGAFIAGFLVRHFEIYIQGINIYFNLLITAIIGAIILLIIIKLIKRAF